MKQTNWDGKEVLLVEVPHDADSLTLHIHPEDDYFVLGYELQNNDEESGFYGEWVEYDIDLPKQMWQFAFASPLSPTEIEAGEWVGCVSGWKNEIYYNYSADGRDYRDIVESAFVSKIESLHSRIKSEGFTHPERVVLLTKK